jgi:hypothetical protein
VFIPVYLSQAEVQLVVVVNFFTIKKTEILCVAVGLNIEMRCTHAVS